MKKALFTALLSLITIIAFGQNSNSGPIKFLGIPIDGTESQFVAKLRSKGFTYNSLCECYKGQFNGSLVEVYIHTNHNVVDRVYVAFPYTTEENIRIDFNTLLNQFRENKKYRDLSLNTEIPEDEDISYEITANNKRYQASFSYFDGDRDKAEFIDKLVDGYSEFFTNEELDSLRENIKQLFGASEENQNEAIQKLNEEIQKTEYIKTAENAEEASEKFQRLMLSTMYTMASLADGDVWFMIHEHYGKYQIGLYYDNMHNQAHGEDL